VDGWSSCPSCGTSLGWRSCGPSSTRAWSPMTDRRSRGKSLEESVATIEAEGLDRFAHVIGDDHSSSADALVLTRRDGVWTSFSTTERAGVEETGVRTDEELSDALDDFLRLMRLRADEDVIMSRIREKNRLAHETWRASRDDRPGRA